jgi:hypothetical protein
MILQALASLTTALSLVAGRVSGPVSAPAPQVAAGPTAELASFQTSRSPTFENEPVLTFKNVVQNFRQANQLLIAVEDASQGLDAERASRIEPVLALLEEQMKEAASQLTAVEGVHPSSDRPEMVEGINSDLSAVTSDLKKLASAIDNSDYL